MSDTQEEMDAKAAEREEEFFDYERRERVKRERLACLMGMCATIISGWTNSSAGFLSAAKEVSGASFYEEAPLTVVQKDNKSVMASATWSLVEEIEQQARIMGIVPESWGGK